LACAVEEADWQRTLDYAAQSTNILPALGVHPWYLDNLKEDWLERLEALLRQHPGALVGEIGLCKMAKNLRTDPRGKEFALQRQRDAFETQFRLAARLRRPVSVHCVKQHGVFMAVLEEIKQQTLEPFELSYTKNEADRQSAVQALKEAFPPAIGMHSFTGTAHQVKQILMFEQSLLLEDAIPIPKWRRKQKKQQQQQQADHAQAQGNNKDEVEVDRAKEEAGGARNKDGDNNPQQKKSMTHDHEHKPPLPLVYFGFSHTINVLMCSSEKSKRQGQDAVRAVPTDRLLAESDVHAADDVAIGTAGAIANLAEALERPLKEVASITTANGLAFLGRIHSQYVESETLTLSPAET
jgi:Tat protein secretion system quality control protein TatD with DNase activity